MSKHTPTPWHVVPETLGNIRAENDVDVAQVFQTQHARSAADHAERLANAELICRAVNSHDALVEALKAVVDCHNRSATQAGWADAAAQCRAALRAAGVEP